MAGRVRSRADDWASSSGIGIGGGQGKGHFHTRQEINLDTADELPELPDTKKTTKPANPTYRTTNSAYGMDAELMQPHSIFAGRKGKFTDEHAGAPQRTSCMNTSLDKAPIGRNPQFGCSMNAETLI
eukprot:NODE_2117_length_649_cov_58.272031_g2067_i0.p1 GENE.NODE_2117_length_649_cov_58.272031_g2067_i0~~NODE_2117_length_649_cov_58.272031_g2067_i0.p1  ORF type:complete len:127 (-),score=15.50 NODE_2117_length_649_cov_58.272031_g2067_i0:184-564(-)